MKRICQILVLLLWATVYCGTPFIMDTPEGFAHYHKERRFLKYIASDGVRIKASHYKNEQHGDCAMWQQALENYFFQNGYHLHTKNEINAKNLKGIYTEYRIIYNAEPFMYGVALFVDNDTVYVIEVGGAEKSYLNRRGKIIDAIQSFSIK